MTAFISSLITNLRRVTIRQQSLFSDRLIQFRLHSAFSTSSPLRGLEEFFPPLTDNPSDLVEESEKAGQFIVYKIVTAVMEGVTAIGRPWKKNELRLKSNEELHKLW